MSDRSMHFACQQKNLRRFIPLKRTSYLKNTIKRTEKAFNFFVGIKLKTKEHWYSCVA